MEKKLKIAVYCADGLGEFIQPIMDQLSKHHMVRVSNAQKPEEAVMLSRWADVVWLEWGNEVAIKLSRAKGVLDDKHTILRVHSYEIFSNYLHQIRWDVIDTLVCPSKYTLAMAIQAGDLAGNVHRIKKVVIPSGVDLGEFPYKQKEFGKDIAFVARLNHKKGIPLMLQVANAMPGYTLHIAGEWQESRFKMYYDHMVKEMGLQSRIKFHGWVDHKEMPTWLADKNFILTTSPFESQGLGIMEAMAMGIKPLVHNFPGASELYPADCLWNNLGDLQRVLQNPYESQAYRTHIEKNFNSKLVMRRVNKIIPNNNDIQQAKAALAISSANTIPENGQPQETSKVKLTQDQLPRFAVCLMFANEEKNLPRCLESIKDHADIIVGLDTGSKDSSNSIMESHGAIVHLPTDLDELFTDTPTGRRMMFGPARNKLLSYVPEDIDWLMMIDCDEELITDWTLDQLKQFLGTLDEKYNAVALNMKDMQGGKVMMDFNTTKIFRRGKVHFAQIVHNEPVCDGPAALCQNISMNHYGYDMTPEELEEKAKRTLGLLDKRIEDNSQDWKAFFYKGQALGFYDKENYDAIIACTLPYLEHRAEIVNFNLSAYFTLIQALMKKGEVKLSWDWIMKARAILPDDLDIAMSMLEFGVWTKNDQLTATGCIEFMRIYELFEKDPHKKGGRFIYSHNQDALTFATFHQTASHLRRGAESLARFQEQVVLVPEDMRASMMKEMTAALESTGISLVQPEEIKTAPTGHSSSVH